MRTIFIFSSLLYCQFNRCANQISLKTREQTHSSSCWIYYFYNQFLLCWCFKKHMIRISNFCFSLWKISWRLFRVVPIFIIYFNDYVISKDFRLIARLMTVLFCSSLFTTIMFHSNQMDNTTNILHSQLLN